MQKNWLVTGSSKGLGREVVRKALEMGDKVLATARNPDLLRDMAAAFPARLELFNLDVTDEDGAKAAVEAGIAAFGRLDVLVNNAGYARIGPFEVLEPRDFRDQVETNLFGVVNMTRAVLPSMRRQRDGHIINISSVGGRVGAPGLSAYQAAKWAVSGFTESVSREVRPFGVKMISVEPGGIRTDWGATAKGRVDQVFPAYEASVGAFLKMMTRFVGNEVGDPAKMAKVIFDLTRLEDLPDHLLLGSDALRVFAEADAARQKASQEWIEVSRATDYDRATLSYLQGAKGIIAT